MKNNIGWIVAFLLLLSRPALAEVNINITPWDLYAAAALIQGNPDWAANCANNLIKKRPR